jgi:two-component system, chemotaxis family, protein-glutamate methylesterase/glutaminase
MKMKSIGVLIVDDSAFMRKLLSDFINEDPNMHVVGIARDGRDALDKVEKWNPDVVTLDVELPDMNGLEVLKQLMTIHPLPVVMVSTLTQRGAQTTLEAMAWGAIDFVAKPSGAISHDLHKVKDELVSKIKIAAKVNIKQAHVHPTIEIPEMKTYDCILPRTQKLVCIGASTGGPRALQTVIKGLPKGLQAPIFIVQHLPAPFTATLAERLNALSSSRVKEAENGEIVQNGVIYLAPGGYHLKVRMSGPNLVIELDDSAPVHGVKPAFDVLLNSISTISDQELVVAVLTGMGSDGARGLLDIKQNQKFYAIAESSETAVIFGMPKAAINTGVVSAVVPLHQIAQEIVNQLNI